MDPEDLIKITTALSDQLLDIQKTQVLRQQIRRDDMTDGEKALDDCIKGKFDECVADQILGGASNTTALSVCSSLLESGLLELFCGIGDILDDILSE